MQALRRITTCISTAKQLNPRPSPPAVAATANPHFNSATRFLSSKNGEQEWNEAWESAWLPEDLTPTARAPWEKDVNFPSSSLETADAETKAFVEEMNENWEERRKGSKEKEKKERAQSEQNGALYSLENMKRDYRLKKQRVHAGLWVKEIEKVEEAKLGDSPDDIQRLLDTCSDIFDSGNNDLSNVEVPVSEFKNMPDGWEKTSKTQDGNIWEMSQREEDILLQEFDRRIAYNKFQIASFIKTHIFSRRRPIDGWKYMIEVVGPNAKRGKGSVSRVPSLSDPTTQPFKEEKTSVDKSHKNYIPIER